MLGLLSFSWDYSSRYKTCQHHDWFHGEVLLVDWGLAKHINDEDEKINTNSSFDFGDAFLTHDGIIK